MTTTADAAPRSGRLDRLTPKEQACLRLVASHRSSKEIARQLGISKTSVDTYCDRARAKLGVRGRREAARLLAAALTEVAPADAVAADLPAAAAPPAARRRGWLKPRLALAIAAAVMAPLAVATLLAGLRALKEVVPPATQPADAVAVQPAHRG
jgi:DNA-binding CsgD family transcriptional regulator